MEKTEGVVLMDLVTGHLPTDRTFRLQRRHHMVRWVLVPREDSSMAEFLDVAFRCTKPALWGEADPHLARLLSSRRAELLGSLRVELHHMFLVSVFFEVHAEF
jgi:hypothetical protein